MYKLTEQQEAIRRAVDEFALKEMAPHIRQWEADGEMPLTLLKQLGDMGILGILVPPELGGSGGDYMTLAIVYEDLTTITGAVCMDFAIHASVEHSIVAYGSDEQKQHYLKDLMAGRILGAFALTEPEAGSDAAAITTFARREGDSYVLNGSKRFITNGGRADLYMVMAKTDRDQGARGISAFLIEKGTPGFIPGRIENKLGVRYSPTGELFFRECRVPASCRLGQEGEGFKAALVNIDGARICAAATGLGIAQAALNCAISYSKEQFALGSLNAPSQALQFMMADMAVEIEASRLLTYQAAWLRDNGEPATYAASMAKLFATDTGIKVATRAVQVLGLFGCTRDFPAERYFREAKLAQIAEGTNEIQRIIIARQLLGLK